MPRVSRRWAIVAVIAFAAQTGLLVLMHLLPTGYDPTVHFVSEYAIGPYGWLATGLPAVHLVGLVAVCGAFHASGIAPFGSWVSVMVLLAILARSLAVVFPVDPVAEAFEGGGRPQFTPSGWIHVLSGVVWAVAILVVMGVVTRRLRRAGRLVSWYRMLTFLSVGSPLAYLAMLMTRPATFPAGLLQRLFLAGALAWLITVSVGIGSGRLGIRPAASEGG